MFLLQNAMLPKSLPSLPSFPFGPNLTSFSPISCSAVSKTSGSPSDSDSSSISKPKPKSKPRTSRQKRIQDSGGTGTTSPVPGIIPRKPRRGRRSEAAAVEDFVRDSLERTFASIKQQNPEILESRENIIKEKVVDDKIDSDTSDDDDDDEEEEDEEGVVGDGRRRGRKKKMVVEDESSDWPLDADIGWGIRASEYFEQHPIKNIVGEDGEEIDWEGEMDDNWVNEINSLQWESYAFHPSPLVVLVFERYKRATDNWKTLKELEKAAKVYRCSNDRLPPRTVKIDINIERDLAYALKVKEGPQILFLRGDRILYREKEFRTADELVKMIAHFYYNAKKPSCINDAALSRPY